MFKFWIASGPRRIHSAPTAPFPSVWGLKPPSLVLGQRPRSTEIRFTQTLTRPPFFTGHSRNPHGAGGGMNRPHSRLSCYLSGSWTECRSFRCSFPDIRHFSSVPSPFQICTYVYKCNQFFYLTLGETSDVDQQGVMPVVSKMSSTSHLGTFNRLG